MSDQSFKVPQKLRRWFDFSGRGPRCQHDKNQPATMCRVCGPEYARDVQRQSGRSPKR